MGFVSRNSHLQNIRLLVMFLSFVLLAVNGCEAVSMGTDDSLASLYQNQHGPLRVLTLRHPLIFQKDSSKKGSGIDHDLLQNFAEAHHLEINFIVKADEKALFEALAKNEGDLIAARIRAEDANMMGFLEGPAYDETHLSLFCDQRAKVKNIKDLGNKTLALLEKDENPLLTTRLKLLAPGVKLQKIVNSNPQQILQLTEKGYFQCAFAENLEGDFYLRSHLRLEKVGPVSEPYTLHWVLRPELSDLQTLMQSWFQRASREDNIMRIHDRYRTFLTSLDKNDVRRFKSRMNSVLPLYESTFREAAAKYHLDWRLLASIAFQESHWEPAAISHTGVKGIMQLTLGTAELAGVLNREDPIESIWGGAFYFRYLLDRLPKNIHSKDRLALALVAYNIGYGHLMDAQKLVMKRGRDPMSWRDVKAVLPLLTDPQHFEELEFGAARGYEASDFAERVRAYYSLW